MGRGRGGAHVAARIRAADADARVGARGGRRGRGRDFSDERAYTGGVGVSCGRHGARVGGVAGPRLRPLVIVRPARGRARRPPPLPDPRPRRLVHRPLPGGDGPGAPAQLAGRPAARALDRGRVGRARGANARHRPPRRGGEQDGAGAGGGEHGARVPSGGGQPQVPGRGEGSASAAARREPNPGAPPPTPHPVSATTSSSMSTSRRTARWSSTTTFPCARRSARRTPSPSASRPSPSPPCATRN